MTFYSVSNPFMQVFNLQGTGLNDGDVYFGVAGQDPITNPKTVYWDIGGTDVASQPIPTTGGYLYRSGTPAEVYLDSTYSIKVLDKKGGLVYYQANVFDPVFAALARLDTLAAAGGAGEIGYDVTNTYPAGTVGLHDQGFVSVTDAPFGAKADNSTDDTTAINAAIAYCVSNRINFLHVPGTCFAHGPLIYDNPVDNSMGGVTIYGGTIRTDVTGPLIKTTLGANEASECLILREMTFIHTNPATAAWLLSSGLLRLWMRNCAGIGFKLNGDSASGILQEWDIDSSNRFSGWQGNWINALSSYAGNFSPKFEAAAGGAGIKIGTMHGGTIGQPGSSAESILGPVAEIGAYEGISVGHWYTEANAVQDFKLATTQISRGLTISSCRLGPLDANSADPTFYDIDLGLSEDVVSIGNRCSSRIYDDTSVAPGMLQSIGDKPVDPSTGAYMPTWLNKTGRFGFILPNGMDDMTFGIVAHPGGGGASAVQLTKPMNVIGTCATSGDSVKLPPSISSTYSMLVQVYNGGAAAANVFPSGSDTLIQNFASVASSLIAPGRLAYFACFQSGQWIRVDLASSIALTDPTGGGTIDAQARIAIASVNQLLRLYGMAA